VGALPPHPQSGEIAQRMIKKRKGHKCPSFSVTELSLTGDFSLSVSFSFRTTNIREKMDKRQIKPYI